MAELVDVDDILSDRRSIDVKVGEKLITVAYRPNHFTFKTFTEFQSAVAEAETSEDERDLIAGELVKLVIDWNLASKGAQLPVTKEAIMGLSYGLVMRIYDDIATDLGKAFRNPKAETQQSGGRRRRSQG